MARDSHFPEAWKPSVIWYTAPVKTMRPHAVPLRGPHAAHGNGMRALAGLGRGLQPSYNSVNTDLTHLHEPKTLPPYQHDSSTGFTSDLIHILHFQQPPTDQSMVYILLAFRHLLPVKTQALDVHLKGSSCYSIIFRAASEDAW